MLSVINDTGLTLFSHCTSMGCISRYENACKMYKVTQEKGILLKLLGFIGSILFVFITKTYSLAIA